MIDEITITRLSTEESITMTRGNRRGYWLDDVDWGQVEGSHNTYSYHNQMGVSIVSTTVGSRSIQITGFITNDQNMLQDRADALNSFVNVLEDYTVSYNGKALTFRPDSSVVWSRKYSENNRKGRKFMIQGTAPYPLFTEDVSIEAAFADTSNLFRFPHTFGSDGDFIFGLLSTTSVIDIENPGDESIGITATMVFSGTVINPTLYNSTTGGFIGVDYTFVSGDSLKICTSQGSKSIVRTDSSGNTYNLIKYRNINTTWPQLQPGTNSLAVGCNAASSLDDVETTVAFAAAYSEVE